MPRAKRPASQTPADLFTLEFDEADVLDFIVDTFFEDNPKVGDMFASPAQQKLGRSVETKLKRFVHKNRCRALGPENSMGDWPTCTKRPHPDGEQHECRDIGNGRMIRWKGDTTSDYVSGLAKTPGIKVTRTADKVTISGA